MARPKRAHPNLSRLPHCQATAPRSQTFVSWKCPQYALSCTCVAPRLPASLACARRPAADKHPQTSISLQHAIAHCCRRFRRPQQTPLQLHHIQITCLPSLNVGGAITPPPSHHSPALRRPSALLAPGLHWALITLDQVPQPWFRNHGRSSRGKPHDVEVHTVGRLPAVVCDRTVRKAYVQLLARLHCLRAAKPDGTDPARCFGDKGDVEDITEGTSLAPHYS